MPVNYIEIQDKDPFFEQAAKIIVASQVGDSHVLQIKCKFGYSRSLRVMDQLHEAGIVGEFKERMPREVLIKKEDAATELPKIFKRIRNIPTDPY